MTLKFDDSGFKICLHNFPAEFLACYLVSLPSSVFSHCDEIAEVINQKDLFWLTVSVHGCLVLLLGSVWQQSTSCWECVSQEYCLPRGSQETNNSKRKGNIALKGMSVPSD